MPAPCVRRSCCERVVCRPSAGSSAGERAGGARGGVGCFWVTLNPLAFGTLSPKARRSCSVVAAPRVLATVLRPPESRIWVVRSVRGLKPVGGWGSRLVSPGGVAQPPVVPEGRRFPAPEPVGVVGLFPCVRGEPPPRLTPASPARTTGGCG